ncbi:unnamed protein product [Mesocestoides corti]|uniref:ADAM_CR_2 domain-containing protein n=1 Tax=Mesocestoides corti TaxID=53468 RepID=A0A0R3UG27_MESCO|nr:unnamed protein product [Mesocestoides corti]
MKLVLGSRHALLVASRPMTAPSWYKEHRQLRKEVDSSAGDGDLADVLHQGGLRSSVCPLSQQTALPRFYHAHHWSKCTSGGNCGAVKLPRLNTRKCLEANEEVAMQVQRSARSLNPTCLSYKLVNEWNGTMCRGGLSR